MLTATGQVPDLNLREALPMMLPGPKFRPRELLTAGHLVIAFALPIDIRP